MDKTTELLMKNGVESTTMDEIADYADVSKVTIYKYFYDKEQLLFEVGKALFLSNTSVFKQIADDNKALTLRLHDFMGAVTDLVDSGNHSLCEALKGVSVKLKEAHKAYLADYNALLKRLIDEGFKSKYFKQNLSSEMIFDYISMGIAYYQQNAVYRDKMREDNEYCTRMMEFMIGNIFLR